MALLARAPRTLPVASDAQPRTPRSDADPQGGITISTVATGGGTYGFGADYGTMQNIARWGGGRL